mmetsp:Transcript_99128/g.276030  ORF Transcript_99128/g.276030 Transcript_99128/m.276030 type:complete len:222 (-) Transcript_99128:976-1641(-)
MQADQVLRRDRGTAVRGLVHPRGTLQVGHADAPPDATEHVRNGQDKHQELGDAQDEEELVRLDPLGDGSNDLLHAHQPEQPHHAHDSQAPGKPCDVHLAAGGECHHAPVCAHDEHVQYEPRLEVAFDDVLERELNLAVRQDHARAARPPHIKGPEQSGGPLHKRQESVLLHVEDAHRDHDHVVNNHEEAAEVPDDALAGVRVDDAARRSLLIEDVLLVLVH